MFTCKKKYDLSQLDLHLKVKVDPEKYGTHDVKPRKKCLTNETIPVVRIVFFPQKL